MPSPFETETPLDPVPSYEESTQGAPPFQPTVDDSKKLLDPHQGSGLPLPSELANSRTQRIHSVLSEYVDPLLASQAVAGLYRTTFVLVPSSVSDLQDCPSNAFTASQEAQVVGFPEDEVVKLVRLTGQEHAMEFWRQPAVVAELESAMKARLVASGHKIFDPTTEADIPAPADPSPSIPPKNPARKSFWGRFRSSDKKEDIIIDANLGNLGWRAPDPQSRNSPGNTPTGMVKVLLVWKDVALRIANDMGLYESKHGPALCLTVEVGT